jgi:hypothetical protein
MDRNESRTAHIPVSLLHLAVQVYRGSEMLVEQLNGFCADVFG